MNPYSPCQMAENFISRYFNDCSKTGHYSGSAMFQEFIRENPLNDDEWAVLVVYATQVIAERRDSATSADGQGLPLPEGAPDPSRVSSGPGRIETDRQSSETPQSEP